MTVLATSNDVDPDSLWPFVTKGRGVREVVESLGFTAPKVLYGPVPSADLPWEDLPPSFVVKPSTGSSCRGVFVMRRSADGRFHDLLKGQLWAAEELVHQYHHRPSAWHDVAKDEVLVEELIECCGRPSYDWKIYAFRGEIALICQLDRMGGITRVRYYLPDWAPVRDVFYGRYDRDDPLESPTRPDELLRTAAALSLAVPVPFVRADLYESEAGVVVGELTPFPGPRHDLRSAWDRVLGEAWERGEAALRAVGALRYQLPPAAKLPVRRLPPTPSKPT